MTTALALLIASLFAPQTVRVDEIVKPDNAGLEAGFDANVDVSVCGGKWDKTITYAATGNDTSVTVGSSQGSHLGIENSGIAVEVQGALKSSKVRAIGNNGVANVVSFHFGYTTKEGEGCVGTADARIFALAKGRVTPKHSKAKGGVAIASDIAYGTVCGSKQSSGSMEPGVNFNLGGGLGHAFEGTITLQFTNTSGVTLSVTLPVFIPQSGTASVTDSASNELRVLPTTANHLSFTIHSSSGGVLAVDGGEVELEANLWIWASHINLGEIDGGCQ